MSELIKLKAPDGATGCSVDGVEYAVDKKGLVAVPESAIEPLFAHGFRTLGYVEPAAPDAPAAAF